MKPFNCRSVTRIGKNGKDSAGQLRNGCFFVRQVQVCLVNDGVQQLVDKGSKKLAISLFRFGFNGFAVVVTNAKATIDCQTFFQTDLVKNRANGTVNFFVFFVH